MFYWISYQILYHLLYKESVMNKASSSKLWDLVNARSFLGGGKYKQS